MAKILIVDDEVSHRAMLRATLTAEGYETVEADDGDVAVQTVEAEACDLVLLDLKMPRVDGIEALRQIKLLNPVLPVLIMTANASVDTAVEALKVGAYDYLTKPLDIDEMLLSIERTLEHFELKAENRTLKEQLQQRVGFEQIIGRSKPMRNLFEVLELAAPTDATILITGESGTGKEMVARAIHGASLRREGFFVAVNCVAIPRDLLESELFGHERGSFTGATQRRIGKFEQAQGGTIFLDEIGDMPGELQAKLLRVLQERSIERLGGDRPIEVDVRIVAATHRDLELRVKEGGFREDLYFRLSVVPVQLPALRERREDIPALAEHFLTVFCEKNQRMLRGFSPRAMDQLVHYGWPGNVRELENAIERAVILCRGEYVEAECLPRAVQESRGEVEVEAVGEIGVQAGYSLGEMEKELILKTLEQTGGNRTEAAKMLGISRQTLQNRLRAYGMT
ncbi:MAG: sigma-54-dependent Fis family transcriptional regulator [Gemmatimonadetes bacterium]|jgi:two-component system, NtrC family, response regulator HydG|nr:sigma-54-dependent Fis family transcriptional regulator [Gemmatimonadota bacterium]